MANAKPILPDDLIKTILKMCGTDEIVKMQDYYPELIGSVVVNKSLIKIENYKYMKVYYTKTTSCYEF